MAHFENPLRHPLFPYDSTDEIEDREARFHSWNGSRIDPLRLYPHDESGRRTGGYQLSEQFTGKLQELANQCFGWFLAPTELPQPLTDEQMERIGCSYCSFCKTLTVDCDTNGCLTLDQSAVQICRRCMHNSFLEVLRLYSKEKLFAQIRLLAPLVVHSYGTNTDCVIAGQNCSCCGYYADTWIQELPYREFIMQKPERAPKYALCTECLGAATELYFLGELVPAEVLGG